MKKTIDSTPPTTNSARQPIVLTNCAAAMPLAIEPIDSTCVMPVVIGMAAVALLMKYSGPAVAERVRAMEKEEVR